MKSTIKRVGPAIALTGALGLAVSGAGRAQAIYACMIRILPIQNASSSCSGPVTMLPFPSADISRQVVIDLDQMAAWRTVAIWAEVCSPFQWVLQIGDSPTNGGGGGDEGSTQHDAEAQLLNDQVSVFRSDVGGSQQVQPTALAEAFGCHIQEWYIWTGGLTFDRDTSVDGPFDVWTDPFLFDFPPYDEPDSEDPTGAYADKLYVGLNRTFFLGRFGGGVQRACFFLSTAAQSQATIRAACGF